MMKMIDVLNLIAKGEIKDQTTLKIHDPVNTLYTYTFNGKYKSFYSNTEYSRELGNYFKINDNFLNREVELILPKEKKYLIKLNAKWLKSSLSHVNYVNRGTDQYVIIGDGENLGSTDFGCYQTQFTEKELQSIQPVREFLDDMQGKFELIEVEENGGDLIWNS